MVFTIYWLKYFKRIKDANLLFFFYKKCNFFNSKFLMDCAIREFALTFQSLGVSKSRKNLKWWVWINVGSHSFEFHTIFSLNVNVILATFKAFRISHWRKDLHRCEYLSSSSHQIFAFSWVNKTFYSSLNILTFKAFRIELLHIICLLSRSSLLASLSLE